MNFIKKFKFLILIAFVIVIGTMYFVFKPKKQPRIDSIRAAKGDVMQEVSVVGKVQPAESADLAFERGGKVGLVNVDIGDKVILGQKLAELNSDDLLAELRQSQAQVSSAQASLEQYRAALAAEQAKLNEMKSGTRAEEISIARTKVENYKSALQNAEKNLADKKELAEISLKNLYDDIPNILNDAYSKADDAVNKQVYDLFTIGLPISLSFSANNSQLETDILSARQLVVIALANLRSELLKTHTTEAENDFALILAKEKLLAVQSFLNLIGDVLKGNTSLSSTNLSTYRANLSTARTNANTALSAISDQQQAIIGQKNTSSTSLNTAQTSLDTADFNFKTAQQELDLKLAGYTFEQIAAQEAKVLQAKANIASQEAAVKQSYASVANAEAQLQKNIIYSPINGVVTKQDAKSGEIVQAQITVISVISEIQFEIETNIPELDISKVKIGDKAEVELDAYGSDEKFQAIVVFIDPAEKIIDGISTYKTTLQFTNGQGRVLSGMTADLVISTNKKENVIAIPQRAVINKGDKKIVRILRDGQSVEVSVEVGLRGSDGKIEIISGINEGDAVVTFME